MLRQFRDVHDLEEMRRILFAGRMASCPTDYIHPGDLDWWLYYLDQDWQDRKYIFEGDREGRILGWVLLSPRFNAFDVFVDPDPAYQALRLELFTWAEEQMVGRVQASGSRAVRTISTLPATAVLWAYPLMPWTGTWWLRLRVVSVCVESDNPSAQLFYGSVGFDKVHKIVTYQKKNCGKL